MAVLTGSDEMAYFTGEKKQNNGQLSARQVIIPVLIFLIIQLSVTLVIAFLCGEGWLPEEEMSTTATALSAVLGFAAVLACDRRMAIHALQRESILRTGRCTVMLIFLCLLLAVCLNIVLNVLILSSGVQKIDPLYQQAAQTFAEGSLPLQILAYGILVPVAEESLFRGIVYRFFKSRFNGSIKRHAAAILLTSLVFAVYHGNLTQGLYTFLLSLAFCFATDCGGLIMSVALHIGLNLTSLIGAHVPRYQALLTSPSAGWPIVLIAAVLAAGLVYLIRKISKSQNHII